MITLNCEQGSREWVEARLGIPTASQFSRIVTATGRLSSARDSYLAELLCEYFMGEPLQQFDSQWTEWGKFCEPEAREYYALENDIQVAQVGLIYRDEQRMVAASPDGLVGDLGLLELKCPSPQKHLLYLARNELPKEYFCQVQGQMWVSDCVFVDFMSYHPNLPPMTKSVIVDADYHAALDKHIPTFINEIQAGRDRLLELGVQQS